MRETRQEAPEVTIRVQAERITKLEDELGVLKEEKNIDTALIEGRGEATKEFLKHAPDVVKEITQQIIDNRDIRARERLKKQMRGVFDVIFADTLAGQPTVGKKRRDPEDPIVV